MSFATRMTPRPSIAAILLESGVVAPKSPNRYSPRTPSTPSSPSSFSSRSSLAPVTPLSPRYSPASLFNSVCLNSRVCDLNSPALSDISAFEGYSWPTVVQQPEVPSTPVYAPPPSRTSPPSSPRPPPSPPGSPPRPRLRVTVPEGEVPMVCTLPFPRVRREGPSGIMVAAPLPTLVSPVSIYSPLSAYSGTPITPLSGVSGLSSVSGYSGHSRSAISPAFSHSSRLSAQPLSSRSVQFRETPHPHYASSPGGLRPDSLPPTALGRGKGRASFKNASPSASTSTSRRKQRPSSMVGEMARRSSHLSATLSPVYKSPYSPRVPSPLASAFSPSSASSASTASSAASFHSLPPVSPLPLISPPLLSPLPLTPGGNTETLWGAVYWIWAYYAGLNPLASTDTA